MIHKTLTFPGFPLAQKWQIRMQKELLTKHRLLDSRQKTSKIQIVEQKTLKEVKTNYQKVATKDWIKTIIYILLCVSIVIIGAIFLLPAFKYIWLILVFGIQFLLVRGHTKNFAYRCPECGHEFKIYSVWERKILVKIGNNFC